jgi:hypothetical protein
MQARTLIAIPVATLVLAAPGVEAAAKPMGTGSARASAGELDSRRPDRSGFDWGGVAMASLAAGAISLAMLGSIRLTRLAEPPRHLDRRSTG